MRLEEQVFELDDRLDMPMPRARPGVAFSAGPVGSVMRRPDGRLEARTVLLPPGVLLLCVEPAQVPGSRFVPVDTSIDRREPEFVQTGPSVRVSGTFPGGRS